MAQPTHSSSRILLPVRPWFVSFTLLCAFLLNLLPLASLPLVPDWVLFVLVFWGIREPLKVGMGWAFCLGLAGDVANGVLLGQHALAYVAAVFFAHGLSRRILWFPLIEQALHVLPIFVGAPLLIVLTAMIAGGTFPGFGWLLCGLSATLLWPPLTYLLLLPQYQPVERDENRPI